MAAILVPIAIVFVVTIGMTMTPALIAVVMGPAIVMIAQSFGSTGQ